MHKLYPFHFNHRVNSIPQYTELMTTDLLIKSKFGSGVLEKWRLLGHKALASDLLNTNLHIWAKSDQKAKQLLTSLRALAS